MGNEENGQMGDGTALLYPSFQALRFSINPISTFRTNFEWEKKWKGQMNTTNQNMKKWKNGKSGEKLSNLNNFID
jgi:hypothetical protein